MVTWADKHQSEAKKPFMAVYLKSRNGGSIVGGPSLQKHYRRRRRKTIESSFNSNPFLSKYHKYILLVFNICSYKVINFNTCISLKIIHKRCVKILIENY